jgi:hypothetical protein
MESRGALGHARSLTARYPVVLVFPLLLTLLAATKRPSDACSFQRGPPSRATRYARPTSPGASHKTSNTS